MAYYLEGSTAEYNTAGNTYCETRYHLYFKTNTTSKVTGTICDTQTSKTGSGSCNSDTCAANSGSYTYEKYWHCNNTSQRRNKQYWGKITFSSGGASYYFKYGTPPNYPRVYAYRSGYNSTGTEIYVTFYDDSQDHDYATTFKLECGTVSRSYIVDARSGYTTATLTIPYDGTTSATINVTVETHQSKSNTSSNGGTATFAHDFYRGGSDTVTLYSSYPGGGGGGGGGTTTYYYAYLAYDANGGTNAPATQTSPSSTSCSTSKSFTVTSSVPTRDGYTFLGWSTSPTATTATYASGDSIRVNTCYTTTLYAVWRQDAVKKERKLWHRKDGEWKLIGKKEFTV